MTKHWIQPEGNDLTLLACISAITEPLEMLECLVQNREFVGTDPYYRAINDAIWKAAERVAAAGR